MLFNTTTVAAKRRALRDGLRGSRILRVPGAFNPLCARAIEEAGFEGVYISGAVLSADLALPDIGLTTLSEVAGRGQQIARVTRLPAIIDVDTGFGEPMSAARTIQVMEDAGLAGCHLEDQVNPKRCGHLDNKAVVAVADMQKKVRAAADAKRDPDFLIIARTDARAIEGLDKAIDRAQAYVDAGAEMIFPEAMADAGEFEAFRKALDVPILANMTEFGKSALLDAGTLEAIGVDMVIYPVTTLRLAMKAAIDGLAAIASDGHQRGIVERMQTRKDLYELLRYEDYNRFDQSLYNFKV